MSEETQNNPHDRRAMFRVGLQRIMEPVAQFLSERLQIELPLPRAVLRPPGALAEREFLAACYRCGNCVDACPARSIRVLESDDVQTRRTPYVDPDLAACVVCDELACMRACPSGALARLDGPSDIHMGLARVNTGYCLRSQGQACRVCVDRCPLGAKAVGLDAAGRIAVRSEGCVGCGTCQFYCPAPTKAISIIPHF